MDWKDLQEIPPWEWPEDAARMLVTVLRDPRIDADDLALAVAMAGEIVVINDEMVDALLALVQRNDVSEEIRGRAAISLGPVLELAATDGFDDPDDVPISEKTFDAMQKTLRELYADNTIPKDVRRRILEASVRSPQDWHAHAVRSAAASEDETWRVTAIFCMAYVAGFDKQILAALKDENPEIQYEAIIAAGNWEIAAAWPHVESILTAEEVDGSLLAAAIEAAAIIRPEEAQHRIAELMDSEDEEVAEAACDAMACMGLLNEDDEE